LIAIIAAAGCSAGAERAESPNDVLYRYADALRQGRADEAYGLLSNEAKRTVSLDAFRRLLRDNPDDVREIARVLARPGTDPAVTATVLAPNGDTLTLVYEAGHWRIDGAGIDRYGQATPRQAIVGFLRAYERGRYEVILRYVPDAEREGTAEALWGSAAAAPTPLTAETLKAAWTGEQKEYIEGKIQAIKSALPTARIEQTESRAAMPYGAGGTVLLLRENGLWKIEDF
jgi:hypothetical protein